MATTSSFDALCTLYFAATELPESNLINENKNHSNIFITGNIVVDSLQLTLEKTSPSKYVQLFYKKHARIILEELINILTKEVK